MPAMIGGFGKISNIKYINMIRNLSTENNFNKLGPYLAGLIESDGSIAVHDEKSKAKKYNPKILIVFHKSDKPLADKLCSITKCGKVYFKENAGYLI
jgi:hypothetical protein